MAETFDLEIATPERMLVSEPASRAVIPAKDGYIGILPDHAALLSELGVGVLSFTTYEHRFTIAVRGGYVEVFQNRVRVLADVAEPGDEIDAQAAEKQVQQVEAITDADPADVMWALARLEAAREPGANKR